MKKNTRIISTLSAVLAAGLILFSCSEYVEDLHTDAVPTASSTIMVTSDANAHDEFKISATLRENTTIYHVYIKSTPTGFDTIVYDWWLDGVSVQKGPEVTFDWDFGVKDAEEKYTYEPGNHTIMLIVTDDSGTGYSTSIQLPVKH